MFQLSNSATRKRFKRREYGALVVFVILALGIVVIKALTIKALIDINSIQPDIGSTYLILDTICELYPIGLMILVFALLEHNLKRYHNFEFKKNKRSMYFFFVVESFILLFNIVDNFTSDDLVIISKILDTTKFMMFFVGLWPI